MSDKIRRRTMDNIQIPTTVICDVSGRRSSNSSLISGSTPPKSPIIFLEAPCSPGGQSAISNCSIELRRMISSPVKKVCTMDCVHCRKMSFQLLDESRSPFEYAYSAPCSRKSSGGHAIQFLNH
ncbi:hypothetical protein TCAL_16471 [Tigriopus californicus]|uniref:Uncharacterized protein n=1 Tax=Tigriopus californicus TaxID=6832 RepID=A0A553NS01_TIGCA|nr:hypothetical protein TCAL_16471 [Tigriopus californicus]